MFDRIVGGQTWDIEGLVASWDCIEGSLEYCAAEAIVCFIYSDGVEWDSDNTLVQGFTKFFQLALPKSECIFLWLFMIGSSRQMGTSRGQW